MLTFATSGAQAISSGFCARMRLCAQVSSGCRKFGGTGIRLTSRTSTPTEDGNSNIEVADLRNCVPKRQRSARSDRKVKNLPSLPDMYTTALEDPFAPPSMVAAGDARPGIGISARDVQVTDEERKALDREAAAIKANENLSPVEKMQRLEALFGGQMPSVHRGFPVGERRGERFGMQTLDRHELELTFVGTASCAPSLNRGVSCMAFRRNGGIWLFDVGESSQMQILRSRVRVGSGKLKKIFITHTHGDHIFGVPGILCMFGNSYWQQVNVQSQSNKPTNDEPVEIYGPEGIRALLRATLQLTYSKVAVPYRVHELKNVPYLHHHFAEEPRTHSVHAKFAHRYGERDGGRDIYPDEKGHYHLFDDGTFCVKAAPLQHSVPCVGYVATERDQPGRLLADLIKPHVDRNWDALCAMREIPNKVYAEIKAMQPDEIFTFPDGTELRAGDVIERPKKGRKLAYLGDNCSASAIKELARDADLVVHEATNAFFADGNSSGGQKGYAHLERETIQHGHSTPEMAGKFAKDVNAKRLILNHFSNRYPGDASADNMQVMWAIEDMARRTSGLWRENAVVASWDGMSVHMNHYDENGEEYSRTMSRKRKAERDQRGYHEAGAGAQLKGDGRGPACRSQAEAAGQAQDGGQDEEAHLSEAFMAQNLRPLGYFSGANEHVEEVCELESIHPHQHDDIDDRVG